MEFEGATFVITGGSLGIGRQLTADLIERGARVLVCGRHADKLEALKGELPGVETLVCDVRDYDSVLALRDEARRLFGVPDVLINNAAIFRLFDLQDESLSVDHWLAEIDINVLGTMRVTHAMLPLLKEGEKATIVNVTSPSA
ncbi:MAG: SDR family NAD(P)-dependent oxidoreductase, partial [Myxococcota bacterium]